jgi:hypothetical protein
VDERFAHVAAPERAALHRGAYPFPIPDGGFRSPPLSGRPFIEASTTGKERVTRGEVAGFLTGFLKFR